MNCQYCNNPIPPNVINCPSCGASVPKIEFQQAAPPPPAYQQQQPVFQQQPGIPGYAPKSRVAYILLACFLGYLGVHNFYAGYTGRGVAQLLVTIVGAALGGIGIAWIWALIEIFTVNTDANGVPMS